MKSLIQSKNMNSGEGFCCSGFFLLLILAIALPPLVFLQTLKPDAQEGFDRTVQERAGKRILTAARWEQQRQAMLKEKRQRFLSEIQAMDASREGRIQEALGFALLRSTQKAREEQNHLFDRIGSSARDIQRLVQNEHQRQQKHTGMAVLTAYKRGARDLPEFRKAFQKEFTRLTLVDQRRRDRLENDLRELLVKAGEWKGQEALILNHAAKTAMRSESIFLESDRSRIQKAISGLEREVSVIITPEGYQHLAGFVPEILAGRKGVSEFVNYGFFALLGLSVVWIWFASLASKENPPLDFSETKHLQELEEEENRGLRTQKAA